MALSNFPVDHTAPKPVGGDGVTVKIPRSVIYVVVAILVLTAVYVLGTTIKERVTDPAIDKTVETVDGVAEDIAAIPEEQQERKAFADLEYKLEESGLSVDSIESCSREEFVSGWKEAGFTESDLVNTAEASFVAYAKVATRDTSGNWTKQVFMIWKGPGDEEFFAFSAVVDYGAEH